MSDPIDGTAEPDGTAELYWDHQLVSRDLWPTRDATVTGVDPRDITLEDHFPRYRVDFWGDDGTYSDEYQLAGFDVTEVVAWAEHWCHSNETYAVHLVLDHAGQKLLVRLQGFDQDSSEYQRTLDRPWTRPVDVSRLPARDE